MLYVLEPLDNMKIFVQRLLMYCMYTRLVIWFFNTFLPKFKSVYGCWGNIAVHLVITAEGVWVLNDLLLFWNQAVKFSAYSFPSKKIMDLIGKIWLWRNKKMCKKLKALHLHLQNDILYTEKLITHYEQNCILHCVRFLTPRDNLYFWISPKNVHLANLKMKF